MNKGLSFIAIVVVLMLCFVGMEKTGVFEKLEGSKYGWVTKDQANPYVDASVYHNQPPEIKAEWWFKVMSDPDTRYNALYHPDGVYDWKAIDRLYSVYVYGGFTKDELMDTYIHIASTGKYDSQGQDKSNIEIINFRVAPKTLLSEEGMKIQEELGCMPCHGE